MRFYCVFSKSQERINTHEARQGKKERCALCLYTYIEKEKEKEPHAKDIVTTLVSTSKYRAKQDGKSLTRYLSPKPRKGIVTRRGPTTTTTFFLSLGLE